MHNEQQKDKHEDVKEDARVEGCDLTASDENTKSQLTAKQPSTKKHRSLSERIPYTQRQRNSHNQAAGGTQSQ